MAGFQPVCLLKTGYDNFFNLIVRKRVRFGTNRINKLRYDRSPAIKNI